MRSIILFACLALAASLFACSSSSEAGSSSRPGSQAVYNRIDSLTSCAALQREFDQAMGNVEARSYGDPARKISLSYAEAADSRMEAIGCY